MTPMSAWYWGRPEIEGPYLEQMPLGRWATEDDIAGPIVFLLSDEAAMITGVSLPIDGGPEPGPHLATTARAVPGLRSASRASPADRSTVIPWNWDTSCTR